MIKSLKMILMLIRL